MHFSKVWVVSLSMLAISNQVAVAQSGLPAVPIETVVISVERSPQSSFQAPAAISVVDRGVIDSSGLQVNLSDVLNRVPGITALNRQNYAQDLQLSIRGFGARSTFGIRGVRLIVDGIPATMPDGQGQASSIALTSAQRIEVLRGPLAQLYGNSAGGVVQVFSGSGATEPTTTLRTTIGRFGQVKAGLTFGASGATDDVLLDTSHFRTDGYREHSRAERAQLNAKWEHRFGPEARFTLVVNSLDQPTSLDPLGLTRALWQVNPSQAVSTAKLQDARKSVTQDQVGVTLETPLAAATTLTLRAYRGRRALDNALSIPPTLQAPLTSSGGIVSLERAYDGFGAIISHRISFGETRAMRIVAGLEVDRMTEDRRGYLNNGGQRGELRRDERNRVLDTDAFAQVAWEFAVGLTASAGVRASRVEFRSIDHFIVPPFNPDDSGRAEYSATNPVLGMAWLVTPRLNLYANGGQGFETPTFAELAYRTVGAGLNTDLRASRGRHFELGAKWDPTPGQRVEAALYGIHTRDELVVDTNIGGRATFKNAGRTLRRGAELQYLATLGADWRTTLALSTLSATFRDTVAAGSHLPGMPERSIFAELAYVPASAWAGFNVAVEVVHVGRLFVNDANDDFAPASTVVNLRAGFSQMAGGWHFSQMIRVENATDRVYAGSVIVNEANKRYFEPAPPRNVLFTLSARYAFR